MNRIELEKRFTSLLVRSGFGMAYVNLTAYYCNTGLDHKTLTQSESDNKLRALQKGDPREWVTKPFSEGLEMPPDLSKTNILWQKYLRETTWE